MKQNSLKNSLNASVTNIILIILLSAALQCSYGFAWYLCAPVLYLASILLPMPKGVLGAGVYRESYERNILEYITSADEAAWLETGCVDYSSKVAVVDEEMQVINLSSLGVLPDVLIDNTDYPIPEQAMNLTPIAVPLNKYQTKVTPVTDDELFALAPDKQAAVIERHGTSIRISKFQKAAWNITPGSNTADMPILVTTGDDDGTGRRKLTWDDVANYKRKLDKLDWPPVAGSRRWVFCKDHENDLIVNDQRFAGQFYNRVDGKPFNQLGFEFYSNLNNAYYNPNTLVRKSFGSVPADGDQQGSFIFVPNRVAVATGWTKMYYRIASTDPHNQRNTMNFRHYYIAMPFENKYRGALVSSNAA